MKRGDSIYWGGVMFGSFRQAANVALQGINKYIIKTTTQVLGLGARLIKMESNLSCITD